MAIYFTPGVASFMDLKAKKQATKADPASVAATCATTLEAIIDYLQVYQMVATA